MSAYDNIHNAYRGVLRDVLYDYDYVSSPRGLNIKEKVDYSFKILYPTNEPIITKDDKRNLVIQSYTQKETDLYNSKSNKVEDFAKASKFWNNIANPDGTINSAYGYLIWEKASFGNPHFEHAGNECIPPDENFAMRTPWEWAKQSLIRDKDTRQAFIKFSLPEHHWFGNKDQVCTLHANYLIRDNKLNLTVVMRSNDVVLGLAYDLPWFCSLLDLMLDELQSTYPDLKKGAYTHIAHSMHMYTKDEETVKKMLGE